ncbi:chromosome partitioning protein ParA [Chitinophaga agrisoli]|uniref:Chromosome partitioning protein ParA n=1 Tax=Chitinophaga agrisoli TaxID=2607653 RepID=A0A5B2VKZ4_9BACT|nr:7TM diverse intracellular signaling domain-containing protein [Chitinophaga agrisoli]KAA2239378.1 chromosome partitioning protein ParA [Chitinophaga agrisoli]
MTYANLYLTAVLCCCLLPGVKAQQAVSINNTTAEHIFNRTEITWLEDPSGRMRFEDICAKDAAAAFLPNTHWYPANFNRQSAYWYKVRVNISYPLSPNQALIEFFDQTTDDITVYIPDAAGKYTRAHSGAGEHFRDRLYRHKNFEFLLPALPKGSYVCYFRIRSINQVNVIIVYRSVTHFINYALVEYITYGLFYGIILAFCLYNLVMALATGLKQYIYYILYIMSVGIYEMSTDGIAFQFIWPDAPVWNEYVYGIALYGVSVFALIFTQTLLRVRRQNYTLYRLINWIIVIRTLYFAICLFVKREWFMYKFLEFIPLSVAFLTGIIIWRKGFKPARFFVLGYAFLLVAAVTKLVMVLGFLRGIPGAAGHYSMGFGFLMEMVLLSFSIGDQVGHYRKEKKQAQDNAIYHMQRNLELQAFVNQQLEEQVAERTRELEVQAGLLQEQAQEIARMNKLLEKDNIELKSNIEKITDARIKSAELSFKEFSQKYPDREECYKLLADLKWSKGFKCRKCGYVNYSEGLRPYSRRCNKCAYEESPMQSTIFENNRISINKAFYITYLVYTTRGNISSYQISERTDIRQSTCWSYAKRVKGLLDQQKACVKKNKEASWTDLILRT